MPATDKTTEAAPAREWAHYTEPSWIDVDGLPTAYRRGGSGEPLLFLHGAGMTRMWLPFYEQLATRFDVIVPEHPGFGDTKMPPWLDNFDDLVLHYDAFLRELEIEDAHLVGHSLGGWCAANLAIFYPRRFPTLTLLTPAGLRLDDEVEMPDLFRLGEDGLDILFNDRGDQYLEYVMQEGGLDDTIQAYSESITFARLTWNPRYDYRLDRRLARISAPTLVLGVEEDRIIPNEMAARFAELIPGASVGTVPGASPTEPSGHLVLIELPRETAELISAHVQAAR